LFRGEHIPSGRAQKKLASTYMCWMKKGKEGQGTSDRILETVRRVEAAQERRKDKLDHRGPGVQLKRGVKLSTSSLKSI